MDRHRQDVQHVRAVHQSLLLVLLVQEVGLLLLRRRARTVLLLLLLVVVLLLVVLVHVQITEIVMRTVATAAVVSTTAATAVLKSGHVVQIAAADAAAHGHHVEIGVYVGRGLVVLIGQSSYTAREQCRL